MSEHQVALDRLRAVFLRQFHLEVPTCETDLLDTGLLDSLQLVELLVAIEEEFGRRIPIDAIELDDLRTLSRLATLVAGAPTAYLAAKAVSAGPR